ncbi:MAG: hypothetical protein U9N52_04200 [Campylobacterota bacterium]|nr:hypothetical protein [Campylobacterota bacterium]
MYKVDVNNACSCFLKSGYSEHQSFQSREEAKEEADQMFKVMNSTFCHKHQFSMMEKFGNYTITISSKIK